MSIGRLSLCQLTRKGRTVNAPIAPVDAVPRPGTARHAPTDAAPVYYSVKAYALKEVSTRRWQTGGGKCRCSVFTQSHSPVDLVDVESRSFGQMLNEWVIVQYPGVCLTPALTHQA